MILALLLFFCGLCAISCYLMWRWSVIAQDDLDLAHERIAKLTERVAVLEQAEGISYHQGGNSG